jgi:hypothetical protein
VLDTYPTSLPPSNGGRATRVHLAVDGKVPAHLATGSVRGIHVIRDPRDVVVSGAHYHANPDNREAWLREADRRFAGDSYGTAIRRLAPSDRLLFEMEHATPWTLRDIAEWNYRDRRFLTLKYEDLIVDVTLARFGKAFRFLGLRGRALEAALQFAWSKSLFSGQLGRGDQPDDVYFRTVHSRSGAPGQWRSEFTRHHGQRFVALFGDILVRLGYEANDDWVRQLPP